MIQQSSAMVEAAAAGAVRAFLRELLADPDLAGLTALVPRDRELTITDALPMIPVVMAQLRTPVDQLRTIAAVAHAYLRAAGLRVSEE